ncbi:unnamed protein product, partial [Amoebophrya sp. A120]
VEFLNDRQKSDIAETLRHELGFDFDIEFEFVRLDAGCTPKEVDRDPERMQRKNHYWTDNRIPKKEYSVESAGRLSCEWRAEADYVLEKATRTIGPSGFTRVDVLTPLEAKSDDED